MKLKDFGGAAGAEDMEDMEDMVVEDMVEDMVGDMHTLRGGEDGGEVHTIVVVIMYKQI